MELPRAIVPPMVSDGSAAVCFLPWFPHRGFRRCLLLFNHRWPRNRFTSQTHYGKFRHSASNCFDGKFGGFAIRNPEEFPSDFWPIGRPVFLLRRIVTLESMRHHIEISFTAKSKGCTGPRMGVRREFKEKCYNTTHSPSIQGRRSGSLTLAAIVIGA